MKITHAGSVEFNHRFNGDKEFQHKVLDLLVQIKRQGEQTMATFAEVEAKLDGIQTSVNALPALIESEKAEVTAVVSGLKVEIQALKDQIAAGTPVSQAQLDSLASKAALIEGGLAGVGSSVAGIITPEGNGGGNPTP